MKKLNKKKASLYSDEIGQSIMEFAFMLPVMIGLVMLLVRVNSTIQVSIVNQKYTRAQALAIAYNSPIYPSLKYRVGENDIFVGKGVHRMTVGVSDNVIGESGKIRPKATTQRIVGADDDVGNDDPQKEGNIRGNIRVRNTIGFCTMSFSVDDGGQYKSVNQIVEGQSYPQRVCKDVEE